jgi:hypothetical protein
MLTTVFGLQRRYLKIASNEKIIVEKVVRLVETSNFGFWIISIRGHMQFLGSNQKKLEQRLASISTSEFM